MDFNMPKLGHVMESGTIVKWLKREGESVEKGEVILLIETDKCQLDVESDKSGIIAKIYYEEGDDVPVLQPIADII